MDGSRPARKERKHSDHGEAGAGERELDLGRGQQRSLLCAHSGLCGSSGGGRKARAWTERQKARDLSGPLHTHSTSPFCTPTPPTSAHPLYTPFCAPLSACPIQPPSACPLHTPSACPPLHPRGKAGESEPSAQRLRAGSAPALNELLCRWGRGRREEPRVSPVAAPAGRGTELKLQDRSPPPPHPWSHRQVMGAEASPSEAAEAPAGHGETLAPPTLQERLLTGLPPSAFHPDSVQGNGLAATQAVVTGPDG